MGELAGVGAIGYGIGMVGASLPDLLEPANHPGHRDVFHSIAAGTAISVGLLKANKSSTINQAGKIMLNTAGAGYLSHLVPDSQTAFSLPLITRK